MLDTPQRDQVTVEAETVEDALSEISAEFGENAEIVRAQKLHRGGVGGFFAKEVVQLTARRRREEALPLRTRPKGSGIADVLERMALDADAEDSDFRTVLQRELGPEADEPTAAEFLASVGWEDTTDDGEASSPSSEVVGNEIVVDNEIVVSDETVVESEIVIHDATATFDGADDIPEPVAVGPVLTVVPEPVAVTVAEEAHVEELGEPEPEPEPAPETAAGPVVPLREPTGTDLDDAAVAEVVPEAATEIPISDATPGNEAGARPAQSAEWRSAEPPDAPEGMGAVSWSTTALLRLGLPGPVIGAVSGLDSNDDLGWIEGIAAAVAPHCGAVPIDDVIVVGPHAERLAEPLGLPLVRSGDMAPYDGSFCAMVEDSTQDRQWLEFVRGGRGIHLVVGDEPWQDLLLDEPVAVSWVGETAVADALYLAFTLGATLGFGTVDGFVSSMVRAQPTDIALAVRRIVGRR